MCLALPARIIERLPDAGGMIDIGGVRKRISLELVPDAQPGDYVIVHVGYALQKLDAVEAERTLQLFAEAGIGIAADGPAAVMRTNCARCSCSIVAEPV